MNKKPYILVAGETIVDNKLVKGEKNVFESHPGGSLFNVSIGLGRLKSPVAYLATLSTDFNGEIFYRVLKKNNVNTQFVERSNAPSALAFIVQNKNNLDYQFYIEKTSAQVINQKKIISQEIQIFHYGSFNSVLGKKADYYHKIARDLRKNCLISYDVNVRPRITPNKKEVLVKINRNLKSAHIIKLSDEDLSWSFGNDIKAFVQQYLRKDNIIIYTLGSSGVEIYFGDTKIKTKGVKVKTSDTIGAGDTFMACFLHLLLKNDFATQKKFLKITIEELKEIVEIANGAAAFNCTQKGANPPTKKELLDFAKKPPSKKIKI